MSSSSESTRSSPPFRQLELFDLQGQKLNFCEEHSQALIRDMANNVHLLLQNKDFLQHVRRELQISDSGNVDVNVRIKEGQIIVSKIDQDPLKPVSCVFGRSLDGINIPILEKANRVFHRCSIQHGHNTPSDRKATHLPPQSESAGRTSTPSANPDDLRASQDQIARLTARIAELEQLLNATNTQLQDALAQIEPQAQLINQLTTESAASASQASQSQEQLNALRAQLANLERLRTEQDARIQQLETAAADANAARDDALRQLQRLRAQGGSSMADFERLNAQLEGQRTRAAELERTMGDLRRDFDARGQELTRLQSQLHEAQIRLGVESSGDFADDLAAIHRALTPERTIEVAQAITAALPTLTPAQERAFRLNLQLLNLDPHQMQVIQPTSTISAQRDIPQELEVAFLPGTQPLLYPAGPFSCVRDRTFPSRIQLNRAGMTSPESMPVRIDPRLAQAILNATIAREDAAIIAAIASKQGDLDVATRAAGIATREFNTAREEITRLERAHPQAQRALDAARHNSQIEPLRARLRNLQAQRTLAGTPAAAPSFRDPTTGAATLATTTAACSREIATLENAIQQAQAALAALDAQITAARRTLDQRRTANTRGTALAQRLTQELTALRNPQEQVRRIKASFATELANLTSRTAEPSLFGQLLELQNKILRGPQATHAGAIPGVSDADVRAVRNLFELPSDIDRTTLSSTLQALLTRMDQQVAQAATQAAPEVLEQLYTDLLIETIKYKIINLATQGDPFFAKDLAALIFFLNDAAHRTVTEDARVRVLDENLRSFHQAIRDLFMQIQENITIRTTAAPGVPAVAAVGVSN